MKNHHGSMDYKLTNQIIAALEKGGLDCDLGEHIVKHQKEIVPLIISVSRYPQAWLESRPQDLITVKPGLSWDDLQQDSGGKYIQPKWRQLKEGKLRAERTEGGFYSFDVLTLSSPEFLRKPFQKQVREAKRRGLFVPNAITATFILLDVFHRKMPLFGYSFRTSSVSKNGQAIEVQLTKTGPTVSTVTSNRDRFDRTGIFVLSKRMDMPA